MPAAKTLVRLLVVLLTGILLGNNASIAKTIKAFRVSNWSGTATVDDRTKQLVHCSASSANSRGISVSYLLTDRYVWTLAFSNAEWNFTPGFPINLTLKLEDQSSYSEHARFTSNQTMYVQMRDSVTFFDALRRSRILQVQARGISFDFDVNASDEVLQALVDCVDRQTTRGQHAKRLAKRPSSAKDIRVRDAAAVAEAEALASLIVTHAQISNAQFFAPKDIPSNLEADAAWKADKVLGTVEILPSRNIATLDALAVRIVGQDNLRCREKSFAASAVTRLDQSDVVKVLTSCQSTGAAVTKYYLGVPRDAGGYVILGTSDIDFQSMYLNQRAAKEMHSKVSAVAMQVLFKFQTMGATTSEQTDQKN